MSLFSNSSYDGHEEVIFVSDASSSLKAIIAIHSTVRGPGLGGCRMWPYEDEEAALTDALRLSKAMSYKNALAGLPFGGAKSVILGDGYGAESEALFEAFGSAVDRLGGRYVTAEDVGTRVSDMIAVARSTQFVSGLKRSGAMGGDPAPFTALGVYFGIRESVQTVFGHDDLDGVSVAVQGLGRVGCHLCKLLRESGALLLAADLDNDRAGQAEAEFGARAVRTDRILSEAVDVLAPCALGGVINETTVPLLRARIIAGAANNQLQTESIGSRLMARGILYAPDFVINAGGVISVGAEYLGSVSETEVRVKIEGIKQTLAEIYARAAAEAVPTNTIADRLAQKSLHDRAGLETSSGADLLQWSNAGDLTG